jgi:hypothetical protein
LALLGVLVLAGLAHEATHWLILRRSGTPIRPAILSPTPRLLLSLGLGWSYEPHLVSRELRSLSYIWAPLVELSIWLGGAAFLFLVLHSGLDAFACVCIGWVMLAGNWWLPHGDGTGWRRVREEAMAMGETATGGVAMGPFGTGSNREPRVGELPAIMVTGRLSHWPGVRHREHSDTTVGPGPRQ